MTGEWRGTCASCRATVVVSADPPAGAAVTRTYEIDCPNCGGDVTMTLSALIGYVPPRVDDLVVRLAGHSAPSDDGRGRICTFCDRAIDTCEADPCRDRKRWQRGRL